MTANNLHIKMIDFGTANYFDDIIYMKMLEINLMNLVCIFYLIIMMQLQGLANFKNFIYFLKNFIKAFRNLK